MPWILYKRGTIHPHRADIVLTGVAEYSKKLAGVFIGTLYVNLGSDLFWSWKKSDMRRLIRVVLARVSQPAKFNSHFKKIMAINNRAIAAAEQIRNIDLKKLSNTDLILQYAVLDKILLPARGLLDTEVDAIDIGFENFFLQQLKQATGFPPAALTDLYKKISRPLYQSYTVVQEREIIRLALRRRVTAQDLDKIYQKFWWTRLGWENVIPHSRRYFKREILKYHHWGLTRLKSRLTEIDRQPAAIKQARRELMGQYHLDKNMSYYLDVIDKYSQIHDSRKECQVKSMYAYHLLAAEAGRRLRLKINDLEWLLHREVLDLFCGKKLDLKEIRRRKKAVAVLVSRRGIKIWSGHMALDVYHKELPAKNYAARLLKGMGVGSGIVTGRVRVCQGAKDALQKIKSKKDILVCSMTLPDYVPAMKRAAAIVTDEGGVTCHAAIISRELGIPCIVGTKIATISLHDGDLVEVDAERGIVRKLK